MIWFGSPYVFGARVGKNWFASPYVPVREMSAVGHDRRVTQRARASFGAVLHSDLLIDAPPRTVAGVLRDTRAAAEALGRGGHRFTAPGPLLVEGDVVRLATRVLPGLRIPVRTRISRVGVDGMASVLTAGPLRALTHVVTLTPTPVGTWVCDELRWTTPFGPLGRLADRVLFRGVLHVVLAARAEVLTARAERLAVAPVVVAAAVVRHGRVLAAQRARPPALAGRWELPGGRVEAGEDEATAVVRECREELGTEVVVDGRLGTDLPIDAGVLRVHTAQLASDAPAPRALDHAAVRWVDAAQVPGLDWVDADRAVVADLVRVLDGG